MTREGFMAVPGAQLRFRLAGTQTHLPLLVFENGWGASYEYWAWVERCLSPHARLLFYNRAGIGGSTRSGPQSVAGMSAQMAALLSALDITEPVVVVGHSYGGLVAALHGVQLSAAVRALISLDPSPYLSDPVLDKQMKMVRYVAQLAILCARIGIPDPLFCAAGKRLPQPEGRLLVERSFGSAPSLHAAIDELNLLEGIRAALIDAKSDLPHLIVSAGQASELKGWLGRILAPPERTRDIIKRMQAIHRQQAARSQRGAWDQLPHDHGSLVFSERGASDSGARILEFLNGLS